MFVSLNANMNSKKLTPLSLPLTETTFERIIWEMCYAYHNTQAAPCNNNGNTQNASQQ